MGLFWKAVKAATGEDPREAKSPEPGPLDDIAIAGGETRRGEESPETVGRIVYDDLLGQEPPTKETKGAGRWVQRNREGSSPWWMTVQRGTPVSRRH